MPKLRKDHLKKKAAVSVRQAQNLLSETTQHRESDQQIQPSRDPLSNFFSRRKLTADFEESAVFTFRPLSLDNALIFEVKTPDPAWLMDINSLRFSFEGTVKEIDSATGKPVDLEKTPLTEFKISKEKRLITTVTPPENEGEKHTVKTMQTEVEHSKEYLKGLLVTPAPLLPMTMWRRISAELGGATLPNTAKDLFGFQSYMRVLLEMRPEPMDAQLRCALMVLDGDPTMMPADGNDGLTYRFQAAGNSRTFDYESPIMVDGLHHWRQGSLLPGSVPLRLCFERADSRLWLTAIDTAEEEELAKLEEEEEEEEEEEAAAAQEGAEPKRRRRTVKSVRDRQFTVEVENALVTARCYKQSPAAHKHFRDQLQRQELQVDFPCHFMDYRFIHKGQTTFRFPIPNSPCNPDRFWFCLLTPDQFRGDYKTNQFWWGPNGLKKIELDFGNNQKKIELACNFKKDRFSKLYNYFLSESGVSFTEGVMPLIPPDLYRDGRFCFVIDLTSNHGYNSSDIRALPTTNPVELTLLFEGTTTEELVFLHCCTREETLFVQSDLSLADSNDRFLLDDGADSVRRWFFDPPFRLVAVGPSECGKSTFIKSLFASLPDLLPPNYFKRIRYYFGVWSSHYTELLRIVPEINFESGGPSAALIDRFCSDGVSSGADDDDDKEVTPQLWVIDDLLELLSQKDCGLDKIYSKLSHHCDVSVIFTSQILFSSSSGNLLKTVISNATALFVWRNFKDNRSLLTLSSQIFSGQPTDFISSAVQQVFKESPYEPLGIALSTRYPHDLLRVCSGLLPLEDRPPLSVYLPDWTKSRSRKSRSGNSK